MLISLHRNSYDRDQTTGQLYIDAKYFSDTLEPAKINQLEPLHPCIPLGIYRISITFSWRLQKLLPLISNVPGRDGIRIHPFNRASESLGCIALGDYAAYTIRNSGKAVAEFMKILGPALRNGPVSFEVINVP